MSLPSCNYLAEIFQARCLPQPQMKFNFFNFQQKQFQSFQNKKRMLGKHVICLCLKKQQNKSTTKTKKKQQVKTFFFTGKLKCLDALQ